MPYSEKKPGRARAEASKMRFLRLKWCFFEKKPLLYCIKAQNEASYVSLENIKRIFE
jgi:hypothetical protein